MLNERLRKEIRAHAELTNKKECCGLLVRVGEDLLYYPCGNLALRDSEFIMDPKDAMLAEEAGEIVAVVHSHPYTPPEPTQPDLVSMEASGLPWVIVNWPTLEIREHTPVGYVAPLIGRVFSHHILDCFTLIRDYYKQTLDIDMKDYDREERWWERGQDIYVQNYEDAGFVRVDEPQKHDVLLMQIHSLVPNHAAIFLGDGTILQHLQGRLSGIYPWGGYWQRSTTHVLRHRSRL